jgi:hypothetical protein
MRNLTIAALLFPLLLCGQPAKKKITRAADVPQFQYPISGKVEDLIKSAEAFKPFAAQVRKDVESVLRDYEIDDASTKRGLLGTLAVLDLLEGHDDACLKHLDEVRALEEKPSAKALSGLTTRAIIEAHRAVADRNSAAYRQAVYSAVRGLLDPLPYDVVQNDVKSSKASAEILSETLLTGQIRAAFDPVVQKSGALSSDMAWSLPGMRMALVERIPLRDTLKEALGAYIAAHNTEKKDIWAARAVSLEPGKGYQPINVAVWDSGVDLAIFRDQAAKDASGQPAVIAYDIAAYKTTGNLYPLNSEQTKRFPAAREEVKGMMDLQANVDSPEAAAFRQTLAKLKPDEVKTMLEEVSLFSSYSHGTHVAGILLAGNPYARVVTGRLTFDYKMVPDPCPSRDQTVRESAAMQDYVDFFKRNQVRVVNMSWGGSVKEYEAGLERCGIGKSVDERKQIAREYYDMEKTALEKPSPRRRGSCSWPPQAMPTPTARSTKPSPPASGCRTW